MILVRGKAYRTNQQDQMQLSSLWRMHHEFGFGWGTVQKHMRDLTEIDEQTPVLDLLTDELFLAWLYAWMINAGDEITRADLATLTVGDIEFTSVDESPEVGEEPTAEPVPSSGPTGSPGSPVSGRADDKPAGKSGGKGGSTKPSTKTSKQRLRSA